MSIIAEPGRLRSPAAKAISTARGLYLPTIVVTGLAAWLAWHGWEVISRADVVSDIRAGQFELAGPAVLGFVFPVTVIEQIRPAQRRPLLARGHLLDMGYLVVYALAVVPLVVLLGTGFSAELARLARPSEPIRWCTSAS